MPIAFTRRALFKGLALAATGPSLKIKRLNTRKYTIEKRDYLFLDLVKTQELSIIQELMPPGTSETRHCHERAQQYFYVLEGELTLDIEHRLFVLTPGDGIEVLPGQQHQAMNKSARPVRMTVTSQPPSHGDRINS